MTTEHAPKPLELYPVAGCPNMREAPCGCWVLDNDRGQSIVTLCTTHKTAPELLEALKLCHKEMWAMHQHHQPECKGDCPAQVANVAALNAFARAEGKPGK